MCSGYLPLIPLCSFSFGWRWQTFAMFYWTRFFSGNVILRIDKYPQNQLRYTFLANSYFFLFYLQRDFWKNNKLTDVAILKKNFLQLLFKMRSWMKFVNQMDTFHGVNWWKAYPPNFKTVYMYKYVIVSTHSSLNQFKRNRKHLGSL